MTFPIFCSANPECSKYEARNPKQILNSNVPMPKQYSSKISLSQNLVWVIGILVIGVCLEFRYSIFGFKYQTRQKIRVSWQREASTRFKPDASLPNLFNTTPPPPWLLTFGLGGTNFFHGPQNLQGIFIHRRVHHFAFVGDGRRAFGDPFLFEDLLDTFGPFDIIS